MKRLALLVAIGLGLAWAGAAEAIVIPPSNISTFQGPSHHPVLYVSSVALPPHTIYPGGVFSVQLDLPTPFNLGVARPLTGYGTDVDGFVVVTNFGFDRVEGFGLWEVDSNGFLDGFSYEEFYYGPSFNNDGYTISATGAMDVYALPEPPIWTMLIGSFGVIGAMLRRSRCSTLLGETLCRRNF